MRGPWLRVAQFVLLQRAGAVAFAVGKGVLRLGIELVSSPATIVGLKVEPFALVAAGSVGVAYLGAVNGMAVHFFLGGGLEEVGGSFRRIGCERTAGLVCLLALEQRVPLKLGLDEGCELHI